MLNLPHHVVGSYDLEFAQMCAPFESSDGIPLWKWTPYGMPKIRDDAIKSAFYLYRHNPKTGEIDGPWGTGFFVFRIVDAPHGMVFYYAITNRHVAVTGGASIIRINTKDGGTKYLEFEVEDWKYVEGGDDVCAVEIDIGTFEYGSFSCIPEYVFTSKDEIQKQGVDLGENAFMIGLFTSHDGGRRNIPSARFGNLAMLANDDAPVTTEGFRRPCHIVDMRSRSGFSGAPVFIYRTPTDDLTNPQMTNQTYTERLLKGSLFLRFFGIHCGQFQERVAVRRAPKGLEIIEVEDEAIGDPIREWDQLTLPSSMTIVIPCWRITELLDLEVFDVTRRERLAEKHRQTEAEPPPPALESDLPATDANPNHRRDFNRLLGAAVKPTKNE